MFKQIATKEEDGFEWFDLSQPQNEELQQVAARFKLHEASVHDCLQADHLPKYEKVNGYSFIIFRIYAEQQELEADTVQELTDKIAIFYSADYIITIHRLDQSLITELADALRLYKCKTTGQLLNMLIKSCLSTYDKPSAKIAKAIDYYEENVFLRSRKVSLLKALYYLRRKIDLVRRMLILSYDIIDNVDTEDGGNVNTRDTRDLYIKLQNVYDSLYDNINQLLNAYFSTSSQRTNETMRVLTIFSVFFMPLTFIVGIYGMNFRFMPELDWKYGYPTVMLVMIAITIAIYFWFKKKGWL
ncbi:magnesium transporter [Arcticibacter tournemirensis]|uniref:Magnesium transporter CorA n=1 Tax=Arcticibacter tournemirensis TaxID=699437 RepID=A0A5M9GLY7_9SPHI|nr:CorA family divalent cation transporter [Arcticibacter tournemirensis]KAA8475713.1 magnesium transporter CorA [Arcticibacter tournemirensis]TQM52309.1 magnesium transporter [Arcticibacter tournemirensis]